MWDALKQNYSYRSFNSIVISYESEWKGPLMWLNHFPMYFKLSYNLLFTIDGHFYNKSSLMSWEMFSLDLLMQSWSNRTIMVKVFFIGLMIVEYVIQLVDILIAASSPCNQLYIFIETEIQRLETGPPYLVWCLMVVWWRKNHSRRRIRKNADTNHWWYKWSIQFSSDKLSTGEFRIFR